MKSCREAKRWRDSFRKQYAKRNKHRNGALGWLDSPRFERLIENSKKRYDRHIFKLDKED